MEMGPMHKLALSMGMIKGNLLSIELLARTGIKMFDRNAKEKVVLKNMQTGAWVEEDVYTNDDDLRQTLEKYNKHAPATGRANVDDVVAIRDAFAHGRVFALQPGPPLRLVKFGKKKNGKIMVNLAVDMTIEWLQSQNDMLQRTLGKMGAVMNHGQVLIEGSGK